MKSPFLDLLRKNIFLGIIYPVVILINLFFLKEYKENNLLYLFVIINLTNQFDIGLMKNCFFNNEKYSIKLVFIFLFLVMFILSFFSVVIIYLFQMEFRAEYLFVIFIGLIANEFKSYHDSKSSYFTGFCIKNCLNLSVVFIFLKIQISNTFFPLFIFSILVFSLFIIKYLKLDLVIKQQFKLYDFRFLILNIFTFISGNIDRFIIIPFIGQPLRNNYLYYSETNSKLNGLFGFLNNLFLYKQLKLTKKIIVLISIIFIAIITFVSLLFNIDNSYYIYSSSLIVSVFSQYYIFSKIGNMNGISSSLFPFVGIFFYLLVFYIFNKFFDFNLFMLTITIMIKSLSEMIFISIILNKQSRKQ